MGFLAQDSWGTMNTDIIDAPFTGTLSLGKIILNAQIDYVKRAPVISMFIEGLPLFN